MYIAIIIGIVIISVGAIVFYKGANGALQPVVVDVLSAETVIMFFKRPEVLQRLQQDTNLLAVAVRDRTQNIITLACFNKEANRIAEEFISYQFNSMSEDLKIMFGDKPMIVFS